ncbi:peptidase M28-like protein [Neolewinella xylanilytica]|uniref:Peptidase M28-like protein n=1 Tax=Neolewinella xylanilytica TaxID=1514080 RepID=A0A2S6I7G7_9BACT|nr:M28 family peptidase [Neolewinella xylanilytica]PPK87443.1 peptidase M28-like protein [Neolewinella xylanilytica]
MKSLLYVLLAISLALTACQSDANPPIQDMPAAVSEPREPTEAKPIPKFDRDSAYAYVEKQVSFGPRVVNSDAHAQTREWLVQKLESFGAEVREQDFEAEAYDGTNLSATNIIARFAPELEDRILLAAHWDTRPFADSPLEDDPNAVVNGADDGASGVGVLLEVARQLGQNKPDIGVDIVLLDAEDYGKSNGGKRESWALGAQYYSRNVIEPKPRFGILLDMVGARDANFPVEGNSERYAPELVRKVWRLAHSMGYGDYYVNERANGIIDDHFFINTIAGIPTIDIINMPRNDGSRSSQFVDHWHTGDDNMDVIDKRTLRAAGQVVLATVFREAAGTL